MEVNNQKIIEKYQQVLATRSHDVLVMTLAIEQLEAENLELKRKVATLESNERLLVTEKKNEEFYEEQ